MDIFYSLDPSSKTKEKREIKNPKLEVINLKEEIGNEKIREKELKEEIKKYTVKNDRLIYSFYNPTRRSSITISCKIIEDTDNTYSKFTQIQMIYIGDNTSLNKHNPNQLARCKLYHQFVN
ncbi:MAG: hypothetical protein IPM51_00015 [Sphingobacteriaceae bacterium]|nr:hypothetical protein [Sphingobacteriaceae bacterium]